MINNLNDKVNIKCPIRILDHTGFVGTGFQPSTILAHYNSLLKYYGTMKISFCKTDNVHSGKSKAAVKLS